MGAIAVRPDVLPDGRVRAYVMTLAVLPPYRRLGIARTLLRALPALASKHKLTLSEIVLHVQVSSLLFLLLSPPP